MSEQIREQVSAFLDGELPSSETELLLKRLTRDPELRESFGRYALIGEALRGAAHPSLTRSFAERVNLAIDGGEHPVPIVAAPAKSPRWWRPFAGAAVVAGVAAVAVVALQQRAVTPTKALVAANSPPPISAPVAAQNVSQPLAVPAVVNPARSREALSYTVPASVPNASAAILPPSRLTNYMFAHSKYSSGLGQRGVLADLLIEDDDLTLQPPHIQPVRVAK